MLTLTHPKDEDISERLAFYEELKNKCEGILADYLSTKEQLQEVQEKIKTADENAKENWNSYLEYKELLDEVEKILKDTAYAEEKTNELIARRDRLLAKLEHEWEVHQQYVEAYNKIKEEYEKIIVKRDLIVEKGNTMKSQLEVLKQEYSNMSQLLEILESQLAEMDDMINNQYTYTEDYDIAEYEKILARQNSLKEEIDKLRNDISTCNQMIEVRDKYLDERYEFEEESCSLELSWKLSELNEAETTVYLHERDTIYGIEDVLEEVNWELSQYEEPLSQRKEAKEKKESYLNYIAIYGGKYIDYLSEKYSLQLTESPLQEKYNELYLEYYIQIREYEDILKKYNYYREIVDYNTNKQGKALMKAASVYNELVNWVESCERVFGKDNSVLSETQVTLEVSDETNEAGDLVDTDEIASRERGFFEEDTAAIDANVTTRVTETVKTLINETKNTKEIIEENMVDVMTAGTMGVYSKIGQIIVFISTCLCIVLGFKRSFFKII